MSDTDAPSGYLMLPLCTDLYIPEHLEPAIEEIDEPGVCVCLRALLLLLLQMKAAEHIVRRC